MKNKRLSIIFLVSLLCGCNAHQDSTPLDKLGLFDGSLDYQSEAFQNFNTNYDEDHLYLLEYEIQRAFDTKNVARLKRFIEEKNLFINELLDKAVISDARYFSNQNESYFLRSEDIFDLYFSDLLFDEDIKQQAYDSKDKDLISVIFEGFTEQEIADYFSSNNEEKISKINDLKDKISKISNQALIDDIEHTNNEEYISKSIEQFYKLADYSDQLAILNGYDNYLDYSFVEDYSRSYTYSQASTLISNFKNAFLEKYKPFDYSSLSDDEFDAVQDIYIESFANKKVNYGKIIDSFAEFMGSDYFNNYNHIFNDGYYCFSNSSESLMTAYQDFLYVPEEAVLFFSKDYQNPNTIVHEFSHANSAMQNLEFLSGNVDACETCSQAAEMLFLNYIYNNYKDKINQAYCDYYLNIFLLSMFKVACSVEVELYFYQNYKTITNHETMKENIFNIIASYNSNTSIVSDIYWIYPCLCSPSYYISYLSSGLCSLDLYNVAKSNPENAKNIYFDFVNNFTNDKSEIECWTLSGFCNPFDLTSISNISNNLFD